MAAPIENPSTNDTDPRDTGPSDTTPSDTAPNDTGLASDDSKSTAEGKPLYALAGAADSAIGFVRELPNRLVDAASDTSFRDQVRTKLSELPEDAKNMRPRVNELVEQLPTKAHEFPGRMSEFVANLSHDAGTAYDDLAVRGEGAVTKWRSEYGPKVDEVVDTVKSRVSNATDVNTTGSITNEPADAGPAGAGRDSVDDDSADQRDGA